LRRRLWWLVAWLCGGVCHGIGQSVWYQIVGAYGSAEGVRMVNWWVRRRTSTAATDGLRPGCRRPGRRGETVAARQRLGSRVYSENWRTGEIESNVQLPPTFTRICTYTSPNSNWHTHTKPQLTPKGSNEIKIASTPKSLSPSQDLQVQLLSRFLLTEVYTTGSLYKFLLFYNHSIWTDERLIKTSKVLKKESFTHIERSSANI
jgi:hypothetical protein